MPQYSVTLIFGELAVKAYHALEQGDDVDESVRAEIEEGTSVKTRHFDTQHELDAYLEGVEDAVGYLDIQRATDLDEGTLEKLAAVLAENASPDFSPEAWLRHVREETNTEAAQSETPAPGM